MLRKCYFLIIALTFILASCNNGAEEFYIASDFTDSLFTGGIEGPATDNKGNLYAVNYAREGTVGIVTADKKTDIFVTLPEGSIGNGIRFNSEGNMFIADYTGHNILMVDMSNKKISIFAHDSTMNQPNDIAISKNDILFASDPKWSESTGKLWRIGKDGLVKLLEDSMGTTNGVEVGASENILYVNESVQRNVWVYDLSSEGEISNKRLFIHFDDHGMDGMRCDVDGNLYIARYGKGTVVKISPEGKVLKEIQLKGSKPTNVAFGGPDGKTCYVTMQDRGVIETFRVEKAGREWGLRNK